MKTAVVIARPGAEHQCIWCNAFARGLRRHGLEVRQVARYEPADLAVQWGVHRRQAIEGQRQAGGEIVILERGYLGDRMAWTSVSFGGELNGRAEFRGDKSDGSRFEKNFMHLMRPWSWRPGGPALIMGQVAGDAATKTIDLEAFYQQAAAELKAREYVPRLRPHPQGRSASAIREAQRYARSLEQDLAEAQLVVTWNSNSGVDAVLAGVPTIALDAGSMAYQVAGHSFDEIVTPDRSAWSHRLAWCQWQIDELASGACWEHITS